jgi:uncharacterized protein YjbJ (UPF0337 family)
VSHQIGAPLDTDPGAGCRLDILLRRGYVAGLYVTVQKRVCRPAARWKSSQDFPCIEPQPFKVWSTACRSLTGARCKEHAMSMNKDQVKGRLTEAKGKIKEAAGKLVGNEKLEQKGKTQKVLGEAQAKFGDVKKDVKDAIKRA